MKKSTIISTIIGGSFFAVPYIMELSTPFSLMVGVAAYGAGKLVLGGEKNTLNIDKKSEDIDDIIEKAKKLNSSIINMLNKVEDAELKKDIREIYQTANKIITTVVKQPKKLKYVETFFSYYLPETYGLLKKYDEIENQKLGESANIFMDKTKKMIGKIKIAFKQQLTHLYQKDMIDTSAEMKVFDSMIKSEGFGDTDFKL